MEPHLVQCPKYGWTVEQVEFDHITAVLAQEAV
ncbi:hypothetical protein HMPREF9336_01972 [Segniliparus rugosus ATCC BAA-974]|uniref:Uncharacterized protein n=1 Tax=Segniliparus rugosus (strain ATCC BAA-974 / DSM 45345 / CCUG 50838 / CIP 108380 / JCM 13579 / CDC 945) TaxID=679197 RepID=E5XR50_SEGRC|nr:hypothetical protein HMPREF9336_01972 [Segniliparus rugosus ATCC BAA-974]